MTRPVCEKCGKDMNEALRRGCSICRNYTLGNGIKRRWPVSMERIREIMRRKNG